MMTRSPKIGGLRRRRYPSLLPPLGRWPMSRPLLPSLLLGEPIMTPNFSGKIRILRATLILDGVLHSMPPLWSAASPAIYSYSSISPGVFAVSSSLAVFQSRCILITRLDIVALPLTMIFWYLATGIVSGNFRY